MLADQARYDLEDEDGGNGAGSGVRGKSQFESGSVELTEENADEFVKYINSISSGK